MAQIVPTPLVMKDCVVSLGEDSYEMAISGVTFTPSSSAITFQGLTPDASYTDPGSTTWTAVINYVQDWDDENSFANYLLDNVGQSVTMTFQPRNGSGPSFTATVSVVSGAIGGEVNAFATTSVTLGVIGAPERVVPEL